MPAYTTIADVRKASGFKSVTNFADATITDAIVQAASIIDSQVGDAYALPLPVVPNLITTVAKRLAVALLYMGQYGQEAADKDKSWQKTMEFVDNMLNDVQVLRKKLRDPATGIELPRSGTRLPVGYPNNASSDRGHVNNTAPKVTMAKRW